MIAVTSFMTNCWPADFRTKKGWGVDQFLRGSAVATAIVGRYSGLAHTHSAFRWLPACYWRCSLSAAFSVVSDRCPADLRWVHQRENASFNQHSVHFAKLGEMKVPYTRALCWASRRTRRRRTARAARWSSTYDTRTLSLNDESFRTFSIARGVKRGRVGALLSASGRAETRRTSDRR